MSDGKKPPRKAARRKLPKPAWERGFNGHVLWQGKAKLGKVTLHAEKDAPHKYTWEAAGRAGAADDLDQARRAVEYAVLVADRQLDLFGQP
jgi:hypothetical protein